MASNQELIEKIKSIDPDAKVAGLTNKDLNEHLKSLNAAKQGGAPTPPEPETKEKVSGSYKVAAGKALTTRRGIKSEGDTITVSDMTGGDEAFKSFLKTGHIVKA